MDKLWMYSLGAFMPDRRLLCRPGVIIPGEPPEDFTPLMSDEEIELILNAKIDKIPCPLRIAFRMRLQEGKSIHSLFLTTRIFVKMPLTKYAELKGFSIAVEEGEIIFNPFYKGNVGFS